MVNVVTELTWHSVVSRPRCYVKMEILWDLFAKVVRTEWPKLLTLEFCKLDKEYFPLFDSSTVEVLYRPGPGLGLVYFLNL